MAFLYASHTPSDESLPLKSNLQIFKFTNLQIAQIFKFSNLQIFKLKKNMAIKLIKACKELNVGMSTAMNFFAKQGKEINPDPNTRIDDELYLLLAKEFNKDMALKLEAERQAAERQAREMQTVSIEQPAPSHIETEIPKPKVVGQIELDEAKKAREEAERQAAEAADILR